MTTAKLAQELNLSPTTVSLVLNGHAERYGIAPRTIERVISCAKRWRYQPNPVARQLAGRRSSVIGMLINTASIAEPRLIQNIEVLAAQQKLRVIVGHAVGGAEQVRAYLQDFQARGVEAVITCFHNHPDYREWVYEELRQMPRVLYFYEPDPAVPNPWYVEPDQYELGRIPTQHLLDNGRRRIGFVTVNERAYPALADRCRGYRDALRAAGIRRSAKMLWSVGEQQSMRWIEPLTEADAADVVERLVVQQKADAIVAINDAYAARIISALRRSGRRVPDDVAIVGSDLMDIGSLMDPQITTMDLRIEELAQAAVNLLMEMLQGETVDGGARSLIIPPRLVVRESCGCGLRTGRTPGDDHHRPANRLPDPRRHLTTDR